MRGLIAVLAGDGIGPEVVAQGIRALKEVATQFGHQLEFQEALIGGSAIDRTGSALPADTLDLARKADAVLLGAVGGPKWDPPTPVRPESGLLELRRALGLFANVRPVKPHAKLVGASPLRPEVVRNVDLVFIRELTGGIYFGEKKKEPRRASDLCVYTEEEVARAVRKACDLARQRRRQVTSVDKANVLETSRLWRAVAERVVKEEYPDIQLEHVLVDACAMHLIRRPSSFDVLVTENMFGDILTDEASVIAGSIGMLPSASLGEGKKGLYEPIHGSAPDIAGRGVANPYGTILSAAMLLRHSLGLEREAAAVEQAVDEAIERGVLTPDTAPPNRAVGTAEVGDAVLENLRAQAR